MSPQQDVPEGGARILEFKSGLPARRSQDAPIVHPLRHFDGEAERFRMRQNLAAMVVVILLVVSGFWLIDHLRDSARITACVAAGHTDCVPLDLHAR
jgi:hypothetical protein